MEIFEVMKARHSVRKYLDKPIGQDKIQKLQAAIDGINGKTGLRIQLFTEEPEAFKANAAHYGQFSGCRNYFALVGKKDDVEAVGYYGEQLVLLAQELGLNTCWVALTYKKGKVQMDVAKGEKLHVVIALGYGENPGKPHKDKPLTTLCAMDESTPDWFRRGMDAVLLAPTAVNQQKFHFSQKNGVVTAKARLGFHARMDLGIVKLHFELGAGRENFRWAE